MTHISPYTNIYIYTCICIHIYIYRYLSTYYLAIFLSVSKSMYIYICIQNIVPTQNWRIWRWQNLSKSNQMTLDQSQNDWCDLAIPHGFWHKGRQKENYLICCFVIPSNLHFASIPGFEVKDGLAQRLGSFRHNRWKPTLEILIPTLVHGNIKVERHGNRSYIFILSQHIIPLDTWYFWST